MSAKDYARTWTIEFNHENSHVALGDTVAIAIDATVVNGTNAVHITYTPNGTFQAQWQGATARYFPGQDIIMGEFNDGGIRRFSIALDRSQEDMLAVIHCYVSEHFTNGGLDPQPDDGSWTGRH